ncbi:MAG TPA: hypothetical protein VGP70_02000 [Actinomadura sp.]|nr:hypothetical protein [Actinomadura sp.]
MTRARGKELGAVAAGAGVALLVRSAGVPWLAVLDAVREVSGSGPEEDPVAGAGVTLGDLPSLPDVLADMLGGPVIIEDPRFRVLAYSSFLGVVDHGRDAVILGRHIPDDWLRHLEWSGALTTWSTSATRRPPPPRWACTPRRCATGCAASRRSPA